MYVELWLSITKFIFGKLNFGSSKLSLRFKNSILEVEYQGNRIN